MGWDPAEFEAFNGTDLPAAHSLDLAFEPDGRTVDVPLGPALTQDSAATQRRWVYQSDYRVFIPATLVEAVGIRPTRAQVIALGGLDVQQSVTAAAGPDLIRAVPAVGLRRCDAGAHRDYHPQRPRRRHRPA